MEKRKVQLSQTHISRLGHQASSSYIFENVKYTLYGNQVLSVRNNIAAAWSAADSNVTILPDR